MVKNLISLFIVVVAIAVVVVNFVSDKNEQKEIEQQVKEQTDAQQVVVNENENVSYAAPDFELTTLAGEVVRLSDYQGKKVILNFWATWCPPCKAEMPHMQKVYEEYKDQGVEILAVNLTNQDKGIEEITSFVKDNGLTFTIPLDEEGIVGQKYKAMTIPTSYMIDTEGYIVETIVGPMDENMMKTLIEKAS